MFDYAFMQHAFIVAILISLVCPMIGMFLVLRRYSMIGDALSHASLAGVAVGLLLDVNPIISAFCVTSFFGLVIEVLRTQFRRYAELSGDRLYLDRAREITEIALKVHFTTDGYRTYSGEVAGFNPIDPKYNALVLKGIINLLTLENRKIYPDLRDLFKDR